MDPTIKLELQSRYYTLKIMSLNFYHRRRKLDPIVNNEYYDDEGKTAYMVHTPVSLHRTTTISKALYDSAANIESHVPPPSTQSPRADALHTDSEQDNESASEGEGGFDSPEEELEGLEEEPSTSPPIMPRRRSGSSGQHDNFIYLAQIDWGVRAFKGSKIRFGTGQYSGREVMVKDLFRQEGLNGRVLLFTGEDGKEYKWYLSRSHSEFNLTRDETPIATFHRGSLFSNRDPAHLEIFPEGQHMVDELFVLFIYAGRLRKLKNG